MIGRICQYESNLGFIANPPEGYPDKGVDILGGLKTLTARVKSGGYSNEYDFEVDVAHLFSMARDYHFGFKGFISDGLITFSRSRELRLISASKDGTELPKIYLHSDASNPDASEIKRINGQDAIDFLLAEADLIDSNGPHTRFNQMFFQAGYSDRVIPEMFLEPIQYPGPYTSITFANGTTLKFDNHARTKTGDASFWKGLPDRQQVYASVVQQVFNSGKRDVATQEAADSQQVGTTNQLTRLRKIPDDKEGGLVNWPKPAAKQEFGWPPAAGYFIDTETESNVAVLVLPVFQDEGGDVEGEQYLKSILKMTTQFLEQCKSKKSPRLILDTRGNSGGLISSGLTIFRQLFPSTVPFQGNRISASDSVRFGMETFANVSAKESSKLVDGFLSGWLFDYQENYDVDLKPFSSPEDKLGHNQVNGEKTSNIVRSGDDPLLKQYFNTKDDDAFKPQDILLLSDGMCGSTCSRFAEMLTTDVKIKTLAVGGIPENGPMAHAGGTKGAQVYEVSDYFLNLGSALIEVVTKTEDWTTNDVEDMKEVFTGPTYMRFGSARLNVLDTMRNASSTVPTQFIVDNADCRMWYKPSMYSNPEELWQAAYSYAWGKDGDKICVKGSTKAELSSSNNHSNHSDKNNTNSTNGQNKQSNQNDHDDDTSAAAQVSGPWRMWAGMAMATVVVAALV
jgi:hypothetical protein